VPEPLLLPVPVPELLLEDWVEVSEPMPVPSLVVVGVISVTVPDAEGVLLLLEPPFPFQ
jgi:hypothetical protein